MATAQQGHGQSDFLQRSTKPLGTIFKRGIRSEIAKLPMLPRRDCRQMRRMVRQIFNLHLNFPDSCIAERRLSSIHATDVSVLTLTIVSVIPGPAQQEPGILSPSPLDSGFAPSGAPGNDEVRGVRNTTLAGRMPDATLEKLTNSRDQSSQHTRSVPGSAMARIARPSRMIWR